MCSTPPGGRVLPDFLALGQAWRLSTCLWVCFGVCHSQAWLFKVSSILYDFNIPCAQLSQTGLFPTSKKPQQSKIRIWSCRQGVCRSKNPPCFVVFIFYHMGKLRRLTCPRTHGLLVTGQGLELRNSVESAALPTTTPRQIPWLERSGNFVASQVHWFVTGSGERSHGHSIH